MSDFLIPILATIFFGFFSLIGFYYAFKPYKNNDEEYLQVFTYDFGFFAIMSLIIEALLAICRKVFPEKTYILVFRITAFLIGFLILMFITLIWFAYLGKY